MAAPPPPQAGQAAQPQPAVVPPAPALPNLTQEFAYALATAEPLEDEVAHIFNLCGCGSAIMTRSLRIEGLNTLEQLKVLTPSDVKEMATRIRSATANRGGSAFGAVPTARLRAVVAWLHDREARQIETVPTQHLTEATLREALATHRIAKRVSDEETVVEKPGKFKALNWISWEARTVNYLASMQSIGGFPLSYVIRKPLEAGAVPPVALTTIYEPPLSGISFKHDDRRVHQILIGFLVDTEGYSWVKGVLQHQSGRKTMKALRDHYDGPQAGARRIALAKNKIAELHYKSENAMPFETFATKLTDAFQTLAENGEGQTEQHKVLTMLDKINSNNPQFLSTVGLVRVDPMINTNFNSAVEKLSTVVAALFPSHASRPNNRRVSNVRRNNHRNNNNTSGRNNNYDRSKYPHGIKYKGVDISDPTRFFHQPEWNKLSNDIRHWIHNHPDRIQHNAHRNAQRNASAMQAYHQMQQQLQQRYAQPPPPPPPPPPPAIMNGAGSTIGSVGTNSASTNSTNHSTGGVRFGQGAYSQNE